MKSREWFRPLCPSILYESIDKMFESTINCNHKKLNYEQTSFSAIKISQNKYIPYSNFMSFAPKLTKEMQEAFPAITHYDGTAR